MHTITSPPVTENGILISKEPLTNLQFKPYDPNNIDPGKTPYPLNLYGNQHAPKDHQKETPPC